jgi:hypothetical protein
MILLVGLMFDTPATMACSNHKMYGVWYANLVFVHLLAAMFVSSTSISASASYFVRIK